jgi:hypothetical protein
VFSRKEIDCCHGWPHECFLKARYYNYALQCLFDISCSCMTSSCSLFEHTIEQVSHVWWVARLPGRLGNCYLLQPTIPGNHYLSSYQLFTYESKWDFINWTTTNYPVKEGFVWVGKLPWLSNGFLYITNQKARKGILSNHKLEYGTASYQYFIRNLLYVGLIVTLIKAG